MKQCIKCSNNMVLCRSCGILNNSHFEAIAHYKCFSCGDVQINKIKIDGGGKELCKRRILKKMSQY